MCNQVNFSSISVNLDKMRYSVLFILTCAVIFVNGYAFNGPAYGYHLRFGVPKAYELKRLESSRIIGGSQVAAASVIPHHVGLVALLTTGWMSICGGSLVSNTRIITAAHCWWDGQSQAKQFTTVLGSTTIFTGGIRIDTSAVTVHPNWNTNDYTHDIAVIRITSVAYSNNVQAIPLPSASDVNRDFVGLTGTISGYGKTSDAQTSIPLTSVLYQTSVPVITNAVCQNSFPITIQGSHLCTSGAGNRGTCDGDSGGPLTVVWNNSRILIGIISFGPNEGCEAGKPSVYTRVTAFLTWINAHL